MTDGVIFDIKKFAIHDGPGIRTTVFFKGCPLACRWCHNPEGLTISPQHIQHTERCVGCEDCIRLCPQSALRLADNAVVLDDDRCVFCRTCALACPSEAHEIIGRSISVASVMDQITKDVVFYDASNGGVTFSGGEPLMQSDFLLELLEACGKLDIHRAVDTTGYAESEILLQVAAHTDLFLYDLKHMDSEKHRDYTGVGNERILHNIKLLAKSGAALQIRIPLIPGINDDPRNIEATGRFISLLPAVRQVSLLPFHNSARAKYSRLGIDCFSSNFPVPSSHEMAAAARRLEKFGLQVKIGG